MVERDVGRRPDHDERPFGVEPELVEHGAVGLEVGEVVLLLQTGVPAQLRGLDAVAPQALGRNRVGDDDERRRPEAELVLEPGELVVECRRAGDAEPPRGDRQLVGAVGEGGVEVTAPGPAAKAAEPGGERASLAEPRPAAVAAEHLGLDPVELEQLERLRVVARRDLDLVAPVAQDPDQRPEHEHVGRRGHVHPDPHQPSSTSRKRTASISVFGSIGRSKKRSWATRQSSTDSKPSPSSRANCSSMSDAGPLAPR